MRAKDDRVTHALSPPIWFDSTDNSRAGATAKMTGPMTMQFATPTCSRK